MQGMDWHEMLARRARRPADGELATILAGPPPGTLGMTGGFPNAATFATELLEEIAARLVRDEPGIALQYTASEGIRSVREYLVDRVESTQGRRPQWDELTVTSGGMECIDLVSRALIDPGDDIAVEAPTYLGAIMAFAGYEARLTGVPMDADGVQVGWLEERLQAGYRPKLIYVIPEFQNPSGRTLTLERRHALVELCRRHGVLIFEDVAYRELSFDGTALPSLWSLGPDIVPQAGTFSKVFCPGVRLGWAVGPQPLVAQLAAGKQNTDQCAGALGQRMVEEYGRAGHFERALPKTRALYAAHWAALAGAMEEHMPDGCEWSEPTGGMFTWLRLPPQLDARTLRPAATQGGVAYVPGRPFYVTDDGANEMRLSFSALTEEQLAEAGRRLASVISDALAQPGDGGRDVGRVDVMRGV
jgi:2-aminoadipate transaminase